ncbi:hypothetical protein EYR36_000341 [Pleurotus pulmonarius]|nr:hypothetical protein EYR36_000341 [Pleurotus pulmonarius]
MSTTFDSSPILVAPRPIRLLPQSSPFGFLHHRSPSRSTHVTTLRPPSTTTTTTTEDTTGGGARISPDSENGRAMSPCASASPRPGSEALEEFLSILRPSFSFPSSTSPAPILRSMRLPYNQTFSSIDYFPYNRKLVLAVDEEGERDGETDKDNDKVKERDSMISSPISRTNTRNPFHRHPSYDSPLILPLPTTPSPQRQSMPSPSPVSATMERIQLYNPYGVRMASPSPASTLGFMNKSVLSPAAIPLPLPTPDEITAFAS